MRPLAMATEYPRRMAKPKNERRALGPAVGISYEAGDAYARHVGRQISSADAAGELRDILIGAEQADEGLWIARTDEIEVRARAHSESDAEG